MIKKEINKPANSKIIWLNVPGIFIAGLAVFWPQFNELLTGLLAIGDYSLGALLLFVNNVTTAILRAWFTAPK